MNIPVIGTILCLLIAWIAFFITRPKNNRVFFTGPHSTGKTIALLSLCGLHNKTVTTLSNHSMTYKGKEIIEIVPNDNTNDFFSKFSIGPDDKFVFFLKNDMEIDSFPDCTMFDVTFVMWKKTNTKSTKGVVYLDESKEKLEEIVLRR